MSEKLTPFDFVNNINAKSGRLSADEVKQFNPFIVNKAFSYNRDSVHFANEMNKLNNADKDMQYDFWYHGLPKKKRYGRWKKSDDDKKAISLIQELYGYSYDKAKAVLPILQSKLPDIEKRLYKGGNKR